MVYKKKLNLELFVTAAPRRAPPARGSHMFLWVSSNITLKGSNDDNVKVESVSFNSGVLSSHPDEQ